MFRLITFLAVLFAGAPAAHADLHAPWDVILAERLVEGEDGVNRFDYDGLRADPVGRAALEAYIAALGEGRPSEMTDDDAFAYWANLYNALTIKVILDEGPVRSIRDIRPHPFATGPWGVERVVVEGRSLSLDDVEHDVMRPRFEAALVHYAVNCASIGCPNLKPTAWRGDTLSADLEAAARAYINHPRGVRVGADGIEVSRLYSWFRVDFGGNERGVVEHLLAYAEPELADRIQANPNIIRHHYDWSLNAAPANGPG